MPSYDKYRQDILKANKMSKVKAIGEMFGVKFGNIKDINKAKNRVLGAIQKEVEEIAEASIKRQQKFAKSKAKKSNQKLDRMYNDLRKAEESFRKSYEHTTQAEKLMFLHGKTLQYTDKYSFGAPITFHDIKNRKEFDNFINSYAPDYRQQAYNDYMNKLRVFKQQNNSRRMVGEFTSRLPGLYSVDDNEEVSLSSSERKEESDLIKDFKSFSYVKQREALSIMDEQHYSIRVASEIKKGMSRPEAVESVLYEMGLSNDDKYIVTD